MPLNAPAVRFVNSAASAPKTAATARLLDGEYSRKRHAWPARAGFEASCGECIAFPESASSSRVTFALGLGGARDRAPVSWRRAGQSLARAAAEKGIAALCVDLREAPAFNDVEWAAFFESFVLGLCSGAYNFNAFRTAPGRSPLRAVSFLHPSPRKAWKDGASEGLRMGQCSLEVRDLANLPGNAAPPRVIADFARKLAARRRMGCEVWNEARLRKERCNALLAVARGSHEAPRIIILRHNGGNPRLKPIVLIGKTITFDTGGVSIKPAKGMEWMRYDKSGGMAVLAAMSMIAAARVPRRVVGILAAAENMPGGGATRPGDLVRSRAGRTIEIINTDAEGRLVLADALSVALDMDPAAIVDFATLTGAAVIAVGHVVSAIMGNDGKLVDQLRKAGDRAGERLWPLPLYPEYADMLRTPFADIRNTGDGTAGTIAGGMFLKEFAGDDVPWAHVDLTHAWEERASASTPAGANLFGACLAYAWVRSLSGNR